MNYYEKVLQLNNNIYLNRYVKLCEIIKNRSYSRKEAKEKFKYVETHHILPESFELGGNTDPKNKIHASLREHFILHKLLEFGFRKTEFHKKCLKAVTSFSMSNCNQNRKFTSRQYEYIRKCYIESMSGENNPRYGLPGTFLGKTHTENTKKILSEYNTGKSSPLKGKTSPLKGRKIGKYKKERVDSASSAKNGFRWYTNGIKDTFCSPTKIPEGFYAGRTNGSFNFKILNNTENVIYKCWFCNKTSTNYGNMMKNHFEKCKNKTI